MGPGRDCNCCFRQWPVDILAQSEGKMGPGRDCNTENAAILADQPEVGREDGAR